MSTASHSDATTVHSNHIHYSPLRQVLATNTKTTNSREPRTPHMDLRALAYQILSSSSRVQIENLRSDCAKPPFPIETNLFFGAAIQI